MLFFRDASHDHLPPGPFRRGLLLKWVCKIPLDGTLRGVPLGDISAFLAARRSEIISNSKTLAPHHTISALFMFFYYTSPLSHHLGGLVYVSGNEHEKMRSFERIQIGVERE